MVKELGASLRGLGFKPCWMCALRYVMCIYIDVSCTNVIHKHVYMLLVNGTKTFC